MSTVIEVLSLILPSEETGERREHDIPTLSGGQQVQWKGMLVVPKVLIFLLHAFTLFQKWMNRVGVRE